MRTGLCRALLVALAKTGAVAVVATACSTHAKEEAAKTALAAQSEESRRNTFEAMARALDDRPGDVELFYSVARKHPKLMDRFVDETTNDLAIEAMANLVARHLAEKPDALEMTMKRTVAAVVERPPAREAMNRAIAAKSGAVSDIITDDPATSSAVVGSLLDVVERKPAARKALRIAMEKNRAKVLAFVKTNPGLAKEIAEQVIREEVKDEPVLEKILRATNLIDDDTGKAKKHE